MAKLFGLRKVYTIAFASAQRLEYWTGSVYPDRAVRYTLLGRKAWRTADKEEAHTRVKMLTGMGLRPLLCKPSWEFLLNREDWTW